MSIQFFILAVLFVFGQARPYPESDISKVTCDWRVCTSKEASQANCPNWEQYGTVSNITCVNPVIGSNFSINGYGSLLENTAIESPSYDMHIIDGIVVNTHIKGILYVCIYTY